MKTIKKIRELIASKNDLKLNYFLLAKLYLASILALFTLKLDAQIQNPNWVLFTYNSVSTGTTNIHFKPIPQVIPNFSTSQFYKNTPAIFNDENNNPITSYRGFNSYFDNEGFPVIYVINKDEKTYIFDKHGNRYKQKHRNTKGLLSYLEKTQSPSVRDYHWNKDYIEGFKLSNLNVPGTEKLLNTSREISILKVSCNLLHVIVGELIVEVDLTNKSWDYFLPYIPTTNYGYLSEFLNNSGIKSLNMGSGLITWNESFHSIVRNSTSESKYTIYYIYSTLGTSGVSRNYYLNSLTIDANAYTANYGTPFSLQSPTLPITFNGTNLRFIAELEVSPDGTKLALNDNSNILLFEINPINRNISTLLGYFNFLSNNISINYAISGLEFNAVSNKLIFNRYNSSNTNVNTITNSLGAMDLTSIPTSKILQVSYFTEPVASGQIASVLERGGLELARNGEIYAVGHTGLHKINLSTLSINHTPEIPLPNGDYFKLTNDPFVGQSFATRPLPEQQDGQIFLSEGYQLDDEIFPNASFSLEFNSSNVASNQLKIRGEIQINSNPGNYVEFSSLNLFPASNTKIVVNSGSELLIKNCNIETDNCNSMWEGIEIKNGGGLRMLNNSGTIKYVKDARQAIFVNGKNSGLLLQNYSFERNAKSIVVKDGNGTDATTFLGNVIITYNQFRNTATLKEPDKGQSQINGLNAGKGILGIELLNTGQNNKPIFLENNTFEGGLFGVKAADSYLKIAKCTFKDIRGISQFNIFPRIKLNYASAVLIENTNPSQENKYLLMVGDLSAASEKCTFSNNDKHISVLKGVNTLVGNSNFERSYQKGIEWIENKGCSLSISSNTFLNCASSTIYCDENALPVSINKERTFIAILNNIINNDRYDLVEIENQRHEYFNGNAIMVNELGKTAYTGFNHFEIAYNQINHLRSGIIINGVTGDKNQNSLIEPENKGGIYNINENNRIIINPILTNNISEGIKIINTKKVAIFTNNIQVINTHRLLRNGSAILIENSPYLSVKSNLLKGRIGLRGKMLNTNSEILCNTFSGNRFGVYLSDKHALRRNFVTHGIENDESRSNRFINTEISDIHWESNTAPIANWWIIEYNAKIKQGCYNTGTTRTCSPFFVYTSGWSSRLFPNKVIKGEAPDFCRGVFPEGITNQNANDTSTYDKITQWELDYQKACEVILNNPNTALTPKIRLVKALESIQKRELDSAFKILDCKFEDTLDKSFADLLLNYIELRLNPNKPTDSAVLADIRAIAKQNVTNTGTYVYVARSIMQSLNDEVITEEDRIYFDGKINLINAHCIENASAVNLEAILTDSQRISLQFTLRNGNELIIFGESLNEIPDGSLINLAFTYKDSTFILKSNKEELLNSQNLSIQLNCPAKLGKRSIVNNEKPFETVSIYPNPSAGNIYIHGLGNNGDYCKIIILDVQGKVAMELPKHPASKPLDLRNLATGIYCLIIEQGETKYKFIFEKQ